MIIIYTIADEIATARERLDLYLECEKTILSGAQSYTIGKRSLTRADLPYVWSNIKSLKKEISDLESVQRGKSFSKGVIPRDL